LLKDVTFIFTENFAALNIGFENIFNYTFIGVILVSWFTCLKQIYYKDTSCPPLMVSSGVVGRAERSEAVTVSSTVGASYKSLLRCETCTL